MRKKFFPIRTEKRRADPCEDPPKTFILIAREREMLTEHLSMMLSSGMDVVTALRALEEEPYTKKLKTIVACMRERMENGEPFWHVLEQTGLFSAHAVSLVRIGEKAGTLPEYLQLVTDQQRKEKFFRSRIRSAAFYPVLILTIAFVVGIGVSWLVLPKLALVFSSLNVHLPFITQVLILFGLFLGAYGTIFIPLLFLFVGLVVYLLFIQEKTKFIGQAFILHLPNIGVLVREIELARYGFIMGTLLKAGLPLLEAMEALIRSTDLAPYHALYASMTVSVEEGLSLRQAFETSAGSRGLIPIVVQQMVMSGESSGCLAETFSRIGTIYEQRADLTTKNLTTVLEPILLVIVWAGVIAVALAVILPIYQLVGSLGV